MFIYPWELVTFPRVKKTIGRKGRNRLSYQVIRGTGHTKEKDEKKDERE